MMRVALALLAVVCAGVIWAGCNSGCSNCLTVSPCTTPAGMQAALVYPVSGSTGNSTTLSEIVVATAGTLPAQWQAGAGWDVELMYTPSGTYPGQAFGAEFASAAAPFPTPNATPAFANPQYWVSTMSYAANANTPLPPGTLITATLNNLNSSCYPGVTFGSFST